MGSRPSPEVPCVLCSKPVNLQYDLVADENGDAIHEECYVRRIRSEDQASDSVQVSRAR
jgi:hypothetical protein